MSAASLLQKAAADGVQVRLENDGKLKAYGPKEARARWTPILRDHKGEILSSFKTATPPMVAVLNQDRQPQNLGGFGGLENVVSFEERRAAVMRLLDGMSIENERRRDWWRAVSESRDRLELRSIVTGEARIIILPTRGRA